MRSSRPDDDVRARLPWQSVGCVLGSGFLGALVLSIAMFVAVLLLVPSKSEDDLRPAAFALVLLLVTIPLGAFLGGVVARRSVEGRYRRRQPGFLQAVLPQRLELTALAGERPLAGAMFIVTIPTKSDPIELAPVGPSGAAGEFAITCDTLSELARASALSGTSEYTGHGNELWVRVAWHEHEDVRVIAEAVGGSMRVRTGVR